MTYEEYLKSLEQKTDDESKEVLAILKKNDEESKKIAKERDEAIKEKEILKNFFNGASVKDIKTDEQKQKEELEENKKNFKDIIANW